MKLTWFKLNSLTYALVVINDIYAKKEDTTMTSLAFKL